MAASGTETGLTKVIVAAPRRRLEVALPEHLLGQVHPDHAGTRPGQPQRDAGGARRDVEHRLAGSRLDPADHGAAPAAVLPERAQRAVDHARVERADRRIAETKPVGDSGAEAFHHHVGLGGQLQAEGEVAGGLQVELDGVPGPLAKTAFERAAEKLPIKVKVVARLGETLVEAD